MDRRLPRLAGTWVTLLILALSSGYVASHCLSPYSAIWIIMVLATGKVYLVLTRFMELMYAPRAIQIFLYGWAGTCTILVIGLRIAS